MTNKFVDGIDITSATMIFNTILRQHLVYMPLNELRNQVENVYNHEICGVVSAYWTKKFTSEIKYDMAKDQENGYISLQDFMAQNINAKEVKKYQAIDIT